MQTEGDGRKAKSRLVVASPYGVSSASVRERVLRWVERLSINIDLLDYSGQVDARPSTLLKHPFKSVHGEMRLRSRRDTDDAALLIHREATPLGHGAVEKRLQARFDYGSYDIDDALQWDTGGPLWRRAWRRADKVVHLVERADAVIAGNEIVADWASRYSNQVVVVPTCVDPSDYQQKLSYALHDPPVIGWLGSRSTLRYLTIVSDALTRLHQNCGAILNVIGPQQGIVCRELLPMTRYSFWSPKTVRSSLCTWDVAIMPVPDRLFETGKSGYKLLQYCAAGVPVVASPVGINRMLLDRMQAPAPRSPVDWYDALREALCLSSLDRQRTAERGRALAVDYSFGVWERCWRVAALGSESP